MASTANSAGIPMFCVKNDIAPENPTAKPSKNLLESVSAEDNPEGKTEQRQGPVISSVNQSEKHRHLLNCDSDFFSQCISRSAVAFVRRAASMEQELPTFFSARPG